MKARILVIDDNEKLCKSLALNFAQIGYDCRYRLDGGGALEYIRRSRPDAALLDLALGKEDGLAILADILRASPELPVIMITGFGSIESAVAAMKIGAADYVQKPLNFRNLQKVVENALRKRAPRSETAAAGIVTRSAAMQELLRRASKMAQTDLPVLITGESGTGKERIAHFIHEQSSRAAAEIHCINCAAFPESLLDNELFGHEKGAYTGADKQYRGIFEQADSGSLFLDEIGDMSLPTQAKILRTLQNSEIRRIGGSDTIRIDVRFVCATNRSLMELIEQKKFREDLYYRLSACVLSIPPLRARREDILPLAEHFLSLQGAAGLDFAPETEALLEGYDWPGNARELRNVVSYAGAMAAGGTIRPEDLPQGLGGSREGPEPAKPGTLEESEKTMILRALKASGNNKKRASEILNISRRTLYNKLERYGISCE